MSHKTFIEKCLNLVFENGVVDSDETFDTIVEEYGLSRNNDKQMYWLASIIQDLKTVTTKAEEHFSDIESQ